MSGAIHLTDPDAHKDLFNAFLATVRAEIAAASMPGKVTPFSGAMGGPENKHPIDRRTGEPDLSHALCDGGTYIAPDGEIVTTPDLRDAFVLGAGGSYQVNETGGSQRHAHTAAVAQSTAGGTVNATTLSTTQIPSHGHGIYGVLESTSGQGLVAGGDGGYRVITGNTNNSGGGGSHTHAFSGSSHAHTATVGEADTLPPYYALAYIMQL